MFWDLFTSVYSLSRYEVTVFKARSGFSFGTARQRARLPAEFEAVTPGPLRSQRVVFNGFQVFFNFPAALLTAFLFVCSQHVC